jgi:hypothetical protein
MEPEYFVLAVHDKYLRERFTLEENIQIILLFISLSCADEEDTFLLILLSSWEIYAKPQNSSNSSQ